jgi:hypothetical protein
MSTISRNGQTVYCYGTLAEGTNNCYAVFEDELLDDVYCMDEGETTWTQVVETLTAYAQRHGTELVELQAI